MEPTVQILPIGVHIYLIHAYSQNFKAPLEIFRAALHISDVPTIGLTKQGFSVILRDLVRTIVFFPFFNKTPRGRCLAMKNKGKLQTK